MYVFILSAGRSGSTLLDILIGQHNDVISLGEIAHLPKNISLNTVCSCGEKVTTCCFWQRILTRLEDQKILVRKDPYLFSLGYPLASTVIDHKKQTSFYRVKRYLIMSLQLFLLAVFNGRIILNGFKKRVRNSKILFDEVLSETKAKVIVDSSKEPLRAIAFYLLHPDQTRILVLSRDGRGVLYSIQKQRDDVRRNVLGWKMYYMKVLRLIKLIEKDKVTSFKYDDLVTRFDETMKSIFGFLNLDRPAVSADNIFAKHHILNGNDMRLKKSFAVRHDDEWKTKLDAKSKKIFEKIAGKLNSKLGYDIKN